MEESSEMLVPRLPRGGFTYLTVEKARHSPKNGGEQNTSAVTVDCCMLS